MSNLNQNKHPRSAAKQIYNTVIFEWIKNLKKIIIIFSLYILFFFLFFTIQQYQESKGVELPTDSIEYIKNFMSMINLLILVSTLSFGGAVIAEDYKEHTGNILYPKITKSRILIGRVIASYAIIVVCLSIYYSLIAVTVKVKYESFPPEGFFKSWGWALFYAFTLLNFVIFFSSIMRSTTLAIITSLLLIWIVFSIIEQLFSIFSTVEPVFIITHYGKIINGILTGITEPRFDKYDLGELSGDSSIDLVMRLWNTPSEGGAAWGLSIYNALLLTGTYFRFKTRQFKG